ncbi:carboxymuconolactone decarboxylase family protein [Pararobbsia silviterrae]|uniref:Carboxymuconolactone decarboxylase n=1 Tax=Pararobbsia silviterrae TaxID=1792498 RepID=A0A494YFG9_9BURK|nr:carboxymuconolactone decarboxylase family protein [Pararobbsia silviterrae]RKP59113.1 carboxymuconolactone decarboxylase [Pararobbsia silviterrae]
MSRVNLDSRALPVASQTTLAQIEHAFGGVPNMFKAVANSPAALQSMWAAFGALGSGSIDGKLGEQIAVAIANRNRCEYCLAAHTVLGQRAGATPAEMAAAQGGRSRDPATAAVLMFALKVVEQRAQITDADVANLRKHGFDDGQIVEIMAHVALNLFTNYINVALDIPVDFPKIALT